MLISLINMIATARTRLEGERGQTSAELLGLIVIVGLIIAAIASSGIVETISSTISETIDGIGGTTASSPE